MRSGVGVKYGRGDLERLVCVVPAAEGHAAFGRRTRRREKRAKISRAQSHAGDHIKVKETQLGFLELVGHTTTSGHPYYGRYYITALLRALLDSCTKVGPLERQRNTFAER